MSHLPLFASSPLFSLTSQTPTTLLEPDEHLGPDERPHCDDLRQSGGFPLTVTPTAYEPNITETNVIDSEAISPEDLEPRRIELDRNLGTDPYQIHEGFLRSSLTGDMEEFGKVGVGVSYFQSQMHSEYDSAESIGDSDLEDGKLQRLLTSPQYLQNREDYESSSNANRNRETCCIVTGERSNCKKNAHADLWKGLMSSSSQEPSAPGKPAALFSFGHEEPGDQFKSSVFRNADPPKCGKISS